MLRPEPIALELESTMLRPEPIALEPEPPQGGPLHFMPDHPNVVAPLVGAQASQYAVAHFPHISGIILAGGQSKRMGHDKALLPLPDPHSHPNISHLTFVQHQVTLLTAYCREVFLVVRDQAQAAEYAAHLAGNTMPTILTDRATARDRPYNDTNQPNEGRGDPLRSPFIPDPNLHGPLMGLYSGLSAITTTHALVVAVDMPFIQPALLSFLLAQPCTDAILVPFVESIPQVLLAVYPRSILPLIEARLQEGRRDPRSLLEIASMKTISEEKLRQVDPQLRSFVNINTPEELERDRA